MNARSTALARQDNQIMESAHRAAAARPRKSALAAMADRLQIDQKNLISTLRSTVFNKANDEEFAALIVVANEYQLNPLLKEIYAFPSRGGIMPMIGYDGWVAIMNRHPQFDGYEHNEIMSGDEFLGVETIIHRKDRSHPTKTTVYLDEFKMNTEPWKQKPKHMCRIRSLCQGVRVAFGVTGIYVEGVDGIDEGTVEPMQQARIPSNKELRSQEAESENADPETGEIQQEELSEAQQREIDEQLDAEQAAAERGLSDDQDGEEEQTEETLSASEAKFQELASLLEAADTKAKIKKVEAEFINHRVALDDAHVSILEREINKAKQGFEA
ncbi:RecT family recombinase [Parasphingorhabdus sp. JC815]|uniref:RecT family recombinase n=1 Tax=Parasphingorhabdus sp. JC815 TaxID=3232140 RepID=UPI003457EC90